MPVIFTNRFMDPIVVGNFLIKIQYDQSSNADFHYINYATELNSTDTDVNHLIEVQSLTVDDNNDIVSFNTRSDNIVWNYGSETYIHKINSLNPSISSSYLYTLDSTTIHRDLNFFYFNIFLYQGYDWINKYGIHVTLKGSSTGTIYLSKVLKTLDFSVSSSWQYWYGNLWVENNASKVPITDESLEVCITELYITDIDFSTNKGYIYNWGTVFSPIIEDSVIPYYINTNIYFDTKNFLHISTTTSEINKTLEKSIKDYFEYSDDDIVNIIIEYIITTEGTNIDSGELERFTYRISNEENTFQEVVCGINFNNWIDINNVLDTSQFDIEVRSEIRVNSSLMSRTSSLSTDFSTEILNITDRYSNTITQPVEVQEITNINQTVINKPIQTKIVQLYQPVFVNMIEYNFTYKRENITFKDITNPTYLKIYDSEIIILSSSITSDNKYYFDLTQITPPQKDLSYDLVDQSTEKIIGTGIIYKS